MWSKQYPKWKSQDGKVMPVTEMTDKHLLNSFKYSNSRLGEFNRKHYSNMATIATGYTQEQKALLHSLKYAVSILRDEMNRREKLNIKIEEPKQEEQTVWF